MTASTIDLYESFTFIRKSHNLNQKDLIKVLNIGQSTLSDYENEKINISFDVLEKIANTCEYKIYFINDKKNDKLEAKYFLRKDI